MFHYLVPIFTLGPEGTVIEEKQRLRDLGVELSNDLSYNTHIQNTALAASKLVGWSLRTFRRRSSSTMLTIWKCLIQSKLDYCSQLWSPCSQANIQLLENVQKNFTARINGMENKDYWDRLKLLNLYSQERRRERYQIIFLWKLANNLVGGYSGVTFTNNPRRGVIANIPAINRLAPAAIRRAKESSLAVRGATIFNLLPRELRNITSNKVQSFKTKLDKFLATIPDQPTIQGRPRAAETNNLLHQLQMR